MSFTLAIELELEREADGRWVAEIPRYRRFPDMAYGGSPEEAVARVEALALRVIADEIEHGDRPAADLAVSFARAA